MAKATDWPLNSSGPVDACQVAGYVRYTQGSVVELADTPDSKSGAREGREGSSPSWATSKGKPSLRRRL